MSTAESLAGLYYCVGKGQEYFSPSFRILNINRMSGLSQRTILVNTKAQYYHLNRSPHIDYKQKQFQKRQGSPKNINGSFKCLG